MGGMYSKSLRIFAVKYPLKSNKYDSIKTQGSNKSNCGEGWPERNRSIAHSSDNPTNCFWKYQVTLNVGRDLIRAEAITAGLSKERVLQRESELGNRTAA